MSKAELPEKLKNKVDLFRRNLAQYESNSYPEEQLRLDFINVLFEALGWDMRKDAEREERVLKGKADYILRIGNQDELVSSQCILRKEL